MELDEKFIKKLLQPGDVLMFDRGGVFGTLIKIKRGEKYSHIEIYNGGSKTFASRDGEGVKEYDLNLEGLAAVYRTRPEVEYRIEQGREWFPSVNGQGYDWIGLLSFSWAKFQGKDNHKMFCSEFVMRWFRVCGVELFSRQTDADAVSPGLVTYSPRLYAVWLREDKRP